MFLQDCKLRSILIYFIVATDVTTETKITTLVKLTATNVELKLLNTTIYRVSLGSCALNCRNSPQMCCSFYYNKASQTCSLGVWLYPVQIPRSSTTDLYSLGTICNITSSVSVCPNNNYGDCASTSGNSFQVKSRFDLNEVGNFCNNTAGFTLMTNGSTTACVWISQIKTNYDAAKLDCQNKNGNLLTIRTEEKASIFLNIVQSVTVYYWIGLDDIEQEGVFKWSDDGSVMENTSLPIPFIDELSFSSTHADFCDCVFYFFDGNYGAHLDWYHCDEDFNYICEIYPRCL